MEPKTIKINDVEYIRADSVQQTAQHEVDGMRYAIVRSRDDGVKCGYVKNIGGPLGRTVTLLQARQMWKYDSTFVLIDIAAHGPRKPSENWLSVANPEPVIMLEACGVIYCSDMAGAALRDIPAQKR